MAPNQWHEHGELLDRLVLYHVTGGRWVVVRHVLHYPIVPSGRHYVICREPIQRGEAEVVGIVYLLHVVWEHCLIRPHKTEGVYQ